MIVTVFYLPTLNQSSSALQHVVEHGAISACCVLSAELNAEIETVGNRILGKSEEELFDYVNERLYELEESIVTKMGYHRQSYWFKEDEYKFKEGIRDIAIIIDHHYPLSQQSEMDGYVDKLVELINSKKGVVELINNVKFSDPNQAIPFMMLLLTATTDASLTIDDTTVVQYSNSLVGNTLVLGLPDSSYLNAIAEACKAERQEVIDDVVNRGA